MSETHLSEQSERNEEVARILILDDEPCIAELLAEMLRLLGYAATVCSSPRAALELLRQEQFDVILSDFRMPEMNGDEFFSLAVAVLPELAERIVFLTGDSAHEETELFLKKNSCRHLNKPFDLARVEQVVAEIVANGRRVAAC